MNKKMSVEEIENLYVENNNFKHYVDGYCRNNKISQKQAFNHSVVYNAAEYYKDDKNGKINVTEALYGCGGGMEIEDKSC